MDNKKYIGKFIEIDNNFFKIDDILSLEGKGRTPNMLILTINALQKSELIDYNRVKLMFIPFTSCIRIYNSLEDKNQYRLINRDGNIYKIIKNHIFSVYNNSSPSLEEYLEPWALLKIL